MTFPFATALLLAMDVAAPHLPAVRTQHPPLIDGRLDDQGWREASPSEVFTQQYPFDGGQPSEHTVLRVLYDDEALYFAFDCQQIHTPMVERLTRRDHDSESEWVQVHIDSRNDGKNAFIFAVNISGVLADGQILNQNVYSFEWDENWEAKTALRADGWSAEIRIPLRVLRFDSSLPVQSWGLQATRFIAERQELDMWAHVPRDVATPVAYFGRLDDLRALKGGGALEVRPFALGFGRRRSTSDVLANGYDNGASVGLDLKLHIGPDLTLDGAIHPDFAQVEADQVILNLTNFETFLPEKRPLFLEGAEAFAFPIQVFYSRRIGSAPVPPSLPMNNRFVELPQPATIYGAAKLVGRLTPAWTVGAFSALTAKNDVTVQENGTLVRSTELAAPLTAFNILRLKREFGGSGHLGVIGTSSTDLESAGGYSPGSMLCPDGQFVQPNVRCFHDAFVGGADALVRSPSGNYVASGAFIQSLIHGGPPRTFVDGTTVNPGASAPGGWVRLAKEGGKHIIASAEYAGAGRDLDYNDVGYMQRQNFQELKGSFGYRTLEAGAHTIDTTTVFEASGRRNLSGVDLGQLYELSTRLHLRSFWTLAAAADFQPARFDDREIGNGAALERAGWAGWKVEVDTDPRGKLVAGFANQTQLIAGGAYAVAAQGTLALHALPQLDFELLPSVTWSGGEWRYGFNADTPGIFGRLAARSVSATLRASYTFTPQLSLQTYAQAFLASGHYSDLRAVAAPAGTLVHRAEIAAAPTMAAATPDFEEAALNVNVVLRWEYHLGSTLFLVYSRSQVPAVALTGQPASFDFRQLGNRASADVILFKISFWWST